MVEKLLSWSWLWLLQEPGVNFMDSVWWAIWKVIHLDSENVRSFLQSNLQSQATREVDWQAGRSFSNPVCVYCPEILLQQSLCQSLFRFWWTGKFWWIFPISFSFKLWVLFSNPAVLKYVFFYNLLNAVMPKSHLIHGICYHNNADVNQMLYAFDRKM